MLGSAIFRRSGRTLPTAHSSNCSAAGSFKLHHEAVHVALLNQAQGLNTAHGRGVVKRDTPLDRVARGGISLRCAPPPRRAVYGWMTAKRVCTLCTPLAVP